MLLPSVGLLCLSPGRPPFAHTPPPSPGSRAPGANTKTASRPCSPLVGGVPRGARSPSKLPPAGALPHSLHAARRSASPYLLAVGSPLLAKASHVLRPACPSCSSFL